MKVNRRTKLVLYSIGLACLLANSIVLYLTFLYAYFGNNYQFSADINMFGEAHLEFVLLPLSLGLGIYAIHGFLTMIVSKRQITM
jgi:hypothetical protein